MKKKHRCKKSTAVLYVYYLLCEGKELSVPLLSEELNIPSVTLYSYIDDIDLFIREFHLFHLELIRKYNNIKLKKYFLFKNSKNRYFICYNIV